MAQHSDHGSHGDHSMHHDHSSHILPDDVMSTNTPHDHDSSDHSAHGMVSHMMSMAFHGGYNETILFDFWKISSLSGLIWSMIAIFFVAAMYEGLKYYREFLFWKTYNALQYRAVQVPKPNNEPVEEGSRVVHMVGEVVHKQPPSMFSLMHTFQTFLHIIQVTISFLLMLIFMTYNSWLCVAVVLGAAAGFFCFSWKKSVIVDVTEHCH